MKTNNQDGVSWIYSDIVKDHFFRPRNFIRGLKPTWKFNGCGQSGSAACGDVMKIWLKIDPQTKRIQRMGWKTFGCASAIATTSILSEMVTQKGGMTITKAYRLTPLNIIRQLHGLPPKKVHCSVLGDRALQAAIDDFNQQAATGN